MAIRTSFEKMPMLIVSKKIKKANRLIPRKGQWALYIFLLILSDAAMTFLAFWLAFYLRFALFVEYFDPNAALAFERYEFLIYAMPWIWLAIFALNGLYIKDNLLGGTREYSIVFRSASEGFLLIVLAGC
jgi:hypothetical protein